MAGIGWERKTLAQQGGVGRRYPTVKGFTLLSRAGWVGTELRSLTEWGGGLARRSFSEGGANKKEGLLPLSNFL